jgi:flagellin
MVINTNIAAQTSARYLSQANTLLSQSLARLSSGSKLVNPSDDPGGTAVSMRLDAQINRLDAVTNSLGNATSFSQTQDGLLQNVANALDRMSELAIMAEDGTKSPADRALYNQEFTSLSNYIKDIQTKDFNGTSLFNGTTLSVTIDSEGNTFDMSSPNLSTSTFTNMLGTNVGDVGNAQNALNWVKAAMNDLSTDRATVGANLSRLSMTTDQVGTLQDNLTAANSRIKDVDVATESTKFAQYNILVQAGTAMLAQANATPQTALRLLQ